MGNIFAEHIEAEKLAREPVCERCLHYQQAIEELREVIRQLAETIEDLRQ